MSSIALPLQELGFNTETACEGSQEPQRPIRILMTEPIVQEGLDLLHSRLPEAHRDEQFGFTPELLRALFGSSTALRVRGEIQLTTGDLLAAAHHLKVVGDTGAGVDTIDLTAETRRGMLGLNAPRGTALPGSWLWHDTSPLPAAGPKQAGGKRAVSWALRCIRRGLALSARAKMGTEDVQRARGRSMAVLVSGPSVSTEPTHRIGVPMFDLQGGPQRADVLALHAWLTATHPGRTGSLAHSTSPCSSQAHTPPGTRDQEALESQSGQAGGLHRDCPRSCHRMKGNPPV